MPTRQPTDPWFRPRAYLHFDHALARSNAKALVTNPARVATHAFYPFLHYVEATPRYDADARVVQMKPRNIYYAAHADAHVFAYYAQLLQTAYENHLASVPWSESVIGYRRLGRSNIDFAHEAFGEIRRRGRAVALCFDVKGFFESINHHALKAAWCRLLGLPRLPDDHFNVYEAVTNYTFVNEDDVWVNFGRRPRRRSRDADANQGTRLCAPEEFRRVVRGRGLIKRHADPVGIATGTPISAVLSNIFMLTFDEAVAAAADRWGAWYRRYSDDLLVVCDYANADDLIVTIEAAADVCGLELNLTKFERVQFDRTPSGLLVADQPLSYLGLQFDGQRTWLRSSTMARYYRRMKAAVRRARAVAAERGRPVARRHLYERFTHLGRNNFITYARRAVEITGSRTIRRQISRHWRLVNEELSADET